MRGYSYQKSRIPSVPEGSTGNASSFSQRPSLADAVAAAAVAAALAAGTVQAVAAAGDDPDHDEIRPQTKETRMSCHLAPEGDESDGNAGEAGVGDTTAQGDGDGKERDEGRAETGGAGKGEEEGRDGRGAGRTKTPRRSSSGASQMPAWRRMAEEVESACELCVGDVVRARFGFWRGLWCALYRTHITYGCLFYIVGRYPDVKAGVCVYVTKPKRALALKSPSVLSGVPWFCRDYYRAFDRP